MEGERIASTWSHRSNVLLQVNVDLNTDFTAALGSLQLDGDVGNIAQLLMPEIQLSTIFLEQPEVGHLHIVVGRPAMGMLTDLLRSYLS